MDRRQLYQVPIPRATSSYSPVSHKDVIETLREELHSNNMEVSNEHFHPARDGKQLIGYMDVDYNPNAELGMRVAFRNSYDKTMSVAFVAGSVVWICSNGLISGDVKFVRRHTGTVKEELYEKIHSAIGEMGAQFELSNRQSDQMKEIEVDKTLSAELCGRLFVEEELINSHQLSIIKREIHNPSYDSFKDPNLWSFYNHTTNSFRKAHPMKWMDQHIGFHKFVEREFELS